MVDDEKMAAARASVSRPSEAVVGVALFLPLEKGDGTGEANSLEDNVSDVAGVLQQQFHTSPHWQGLSKAETVERTGDLMDAATHKAYLSGVDERQQSASCPKG